MPFAKEIEDRVEAATRRMRKEAAAKGIQIQGKM